MIEISTIHKCIHCVKEYTQIINKKYCRLFCDMCIISDIIDTHIDIDAQLGSSESHNTNYTNIVRTDYTGSTITF